MQNYKSSSIEDFNEGDTEILSMKGLLLDEINQYSKDI